MESIPDSLGPEGSKHSGKTRQGSMFFEEGDDDPLLPATLKDLQDSCKSLTDKAQGILAAQVLVNRLGKRHPTNVLSERCLRVIQQKASILKPVEERFAEFKAAAERKEELLRDIVDNGAEAPEVLFGSKKFMRKFMHFPGEPIDGDRSIFEIFVTSFKLPKKHGIFTRWLAYGEEIGAWWAEQAWKEAVAGAGHKEIKLLITLSTEIGVKADHHMILRAHQVLIDRLCNHCLAFAKEMWERDQIAEKKAEERGQIVALGLADQLANKLEEEIFKAVEEGGDKLRDEPRIREAQEISKNLREQDNTRKRLHAREARLQEEAKEAKRQQLAEEAKK